MLTANVDCSKILMWLSSINNHKAKILDIRIPIFIFSKFKLHLVVIADKDEHPSLLNVFVDEVAILI